MSESSVCPIRERVRSSINWWEKRSRSSRVNRRRHRRRSLGILTEKQGQIVFVDAPGILKAEKGLNRFLVEEAKDVVAKSDALLVVLNIDERDLEQLKKVTALAEASGKPWLAVINKTDLDLLHRPDILRRELQDKKVEILSGSSLKPEEGFTRSIIDALMKMMPEASGPIYDQELFTPATERELCAEIIREKCFEELHQEVPFGIAVRILRYQENDGPVLKIDAEILVSKESHLAIVVGRQARVVKQIGTEARRDIERMTGRRIFLNIAVATSPNWFKNSMVMKELGYVVQS